MPRRLAAATAVALAAALAGLIWASTPWNPLGGTASGGPPGGGPPTASTDFTAAEIARERAFHAAVHPPAWTALAVGLLVLAVLGFTPLGRLLGHGVARRVRGGWPVQVAAAAIAVDLIRFLATLPFDAWAEHELRRFGLSTQGWAGWGTDEGKSLGLTLVLAVLALLVVVGLARLLPRWWWLPVAALSAALVLGGSFAYPLLVEPLFAQFHPLGPGPLRSSLLAEARAAGVPVQQVLVSNASVRTTELNAYVSGFGASRRIVLYDTLLRRPASEIRFVVAHELGHARHDDVLRGTIDGAVAVPLGVCLGYLVVTASGRSAGRDDRLRLIDRRIDGRMDRRMDRRVTRLDARAVPLVLALAGWLGFVATPVDYLVSRHIEASADAFALHLTRDPVEDVRVQRVLALRGLTTLEPGAVGYYMFFDHPSPVQRIAQARAWARLHGVPVPPPQAGTTP